MAKQPTKKSNNSKLIIGGVIAAIVIAFVIAIVAGGSNDSASSDTTKVPNSDGTVSAGENQPVEVVGDVLEPLPEKTSARRMSNGPNHAAVGFSKQLKERYNALEHIVSETDCF